MRLSIRAASWSAARCVRHFCHARGILHPDVDAFCRHLEDAAIATSVVDWDGHFSKLAISGLGDALPPPLDSVRDLNELVCAAREVTATQMYAAWTPDEVLKHLRETAERAGLDPANVVAVAGSLHTPDQHGWGLPVAKAERDRWSREA
jgi:hypothetical protein